MTQQTCLIIDDVKTSRLSAKIYIEQLKFKSFEAADTQEALDIMNKENIDFVLLDWHLETESGLEFCKELRAKSSLLKIIMMSGVEDTESSNDEALQAGADAFMRKPTTIGGIMECLISANIEFIN